jgi:hypothetical protein
MKKVIIGVLVACSVVAVCYAATVSVIVVSEASRSHNIEIVSMDFDLDSHSVRVRVVDKVVSLAGTDVSETYFFTGKELNTAILSSPLEEITNEESFSEAMKSISERLINARYAKK